MTCQAGKAPSLDDALDELYGTLPEEFVLLRPRLEREPAVGWRDRSRR